MTIQILILGSNASVELLTESYKNKITAPQTGLDLQLALADPLSEIGKRYYTLLLTNNLQHREIELFQDQLADRLFMQTRYKERVLREQELEDIENSRKLLHSFAQSQLKNVPENTSQHTESLVKEIKEFLERTSALAVELSHLMTKRNKLNALWSETHQREALNLVNQINALLPETKIANDQLIQALTPLAPSLVFKLNKFLAEKICEEEKNPVRSPISLNMARINDVMGELAIHALLGTDPQTGNQLMGAALLASIRSRKQQFEKANISFQSENHAAYADMIREGAKLFTQIGNKKTDLKQVEEDLKAKVRELNENAKDLNHTLPDAFNPRIGPLRKNLRYP